MDTHEQPIFVVDCVNKLMNPLQKQNHALIFKGKILFTELITSRIQRCRDKQVTHAHMLRYEVSDEEDQNRNQSREMNICVGHRALLNQFSVPERCSPRRQITELFDRCVSVRPKTLFSLTCGAGK